jgi:hypothetical protein
MQNIIMCKFNGSLRETWIMNTSPSPFIHRGKNFPIYIPMEKETFSPSFPKAMFRCWGSNPEADFFHSGIKWIRGCTLYPLGA